MKERVKEKNYAMWLLKSLLASYIVTGLLLMLLAFLLYKFNLDKKKVSFAIVVIYVLATLFGGFVLGKCVKVKKYIWGFVLGFLYFALLLAITLGVYRGLENQEILSTFILCIGGGMVGGMLS